MLGMGSFEMALAYILSILAAGVCVIYGLINWNKKGLIVEKRIDLHKEKSNDL
ncbi:hypothetical protein SAMN04488516_102285 [Desulfonauticus submarinus]|uniref:Uncharacterized protein n=1 Tax=Desulfonauticus submarinus TaxID=206665 RepID=A0A1H0BTN2_9BACT|nr:symporter small accessory protein [Desulfonauticus submarinus]SDN48947.1 hypothetical protein SAMN04488516_102285 [Desulfonauticus submarinus]